MNRLCVLFFIRVLHVSCDKKNRKRKREMSRPNGSRCQLPCAVSSWNSTSSHPHGFPSGRIIQSRFFYATQVIKPQVESWLMVLDTTQSTALWMSVKGQSQYYHFTFFLSDRSIGKKVHCTDFLEVRKFTRSQLYLRHIIMIHKNTNVSLLIICGYSTREPASVVCDDRWADLFYSEAHTGICINHS